VRRELDASEGQGHAEPLAFHERLPFVDAVRETAPMYASISPLIGILDQAVRLHLPMT